MLVCSLEEGELLVDAAPVVNPKGTGRRSKNRNRADGRAWRRTPKSAKCAKGFTLGTRTQIEGRCKGVGRAGVVWVVLPPSLQSSGLFSQPELVRGA